MKKELKGYLSFIIIISFVTGAVGGTLGSFFLLPHLQASPWGRDFLSLEGELSNLTQEKILQIEEDSATIDVVKKVSPSVVSIVITKELENFYNLTGPNAFDLWPKNLLPAPGEKRKQEVGGGTGFIIDANGLILTNKHVVIDEDAEYSVVLSDGARYEASVLARDTVNDIAVLKIEADDLPVIDLGASENLEIGQTVIAIGNSLSQYQNTVTRGVISGIDRRIVAGDNFSGSEVIDEAIQTDAAINPGNSGGPLLNLSGQVIGINTAISSQGQAIGFAIPIDQAKVVIDSVKEFGKIVRPWLGVRYIQLNEQLSKENNLSASSGALIVGGVNASAVIEDSPADKAGLVEGDIIIAINNEAVGDNNALVKLINKYKPGDEIEIKFIREKAEKIVKVVLTERTE